MNPLSSSYISSAGLSENVVKTCKNSVSSATSLLTNNLIPPKSSLGKPL